ncbi:hypothetical protein KVR01_007485 [Diaporthe batatas]|uniref:uncharacterized protein n=1 Tax=Diaporthe batatas TaxID=748121 RepID=UPI001D03882C|nr:uncharacterized protein KVR01_007485 [Diaporthe batatas]KAG8163007.1 hypothetical protein KVR01_007485 [Diaporthe batatas]
MSLESMVRTVRSALSLESLRESLGRASLGSRNRGDRSGAVPSKWQNGSGGELDDLGCSRTQLSDGASHEARWHGASPEQGRGHGHGHGHGHAREGSRGVQLDRFVEVQDVDGRTVTHVSLPRRV